MSRFHVLRSGTRFRRYRGRRVPFSCLALPDSFSAVPRASAPVLMYCAPKIVYYERPADIGMQPVQCPERLAEGMLGKQYRCLQGIQCPELPADIGLVAVQQR
jgi:hypothetical protein